MIKNARFTITFATVMIFMIAGCGKDDNPQNPDPINTGSVIAKKTIGPDGGTLEGDKLSVAIPAQMIIYPTEITLTRLKAEAYGSNAMGEIYFVNNLPSIATGTLTMTLNLPANAGDNFNLMLCETPWSPSARGDILAYHEMSYTLNGNKAQVVLQLGGNKAGKNLTEEPSSFSLGLLAVSGYSSTTTAGGHFKISYPVIYEEGAEKLGDYLEQAFEVLTQAPNGLNVDKRTRWPIDVTVSKLSSSVFGYFEASVLGDNYASLLFNQEKLNDDVNLRATAIHELMHLIQSLYDPRNRFSKAKLESPTWWLDEAVAVWSEELTAASSSGFISAARTGNEWMPYAGNFAARPDDPQNFGYGMSAMIKYLVKNNGPGVIRDIYDKVAKGRNPAEAIYEGTGKFYWEWYGQFMAAYTAGSVYADLTPGIVLGSKPQTFKFESSSDTVKSVSLNFNPLETKVFKVQMDAGVLNDDSGLGVSSTVQGYEYYAIYKFNSSGMIKLAEGGAPSVPNIKNIVSQGYQFLIMATNTQYSSTGGNQARTLDFKIRLTQAPVYKSFVFDLGVMSKTIYVYQSGSSGDSSLAAQWHSLNIPIPVNVVGNQVSASWSGIEVPSAGIHTGNFTATINPDQSMDYQINEVIVYSNNVTTYSSAGKNIPLTGSGWWGKSWGGPSHLYVYRFDMKEQFDTFYIASHGVYYAPEYGVKEITIRFNTYEKSRF